MATNEKNCILGHGACNFAGQEGTCNRLCFSFIQMHGVSGDTGRVGTGNTPRSHRLSTTANTNVRQRQENAYRVIDKYLKRLFEPRDLKDEQLSLYLYSENPGTGKTSTASAILNTYIVKSFINASKKGETPHHFPAYFLDANEWQTIYNEATRQNVPKEIAEDAWEKYYNMKKIAETVPFLVLDDVAVRTITEGHRGDLHSLINHRVNNCMPTVYTSNIPISRLPEVFGEERLFDRMRDQTLELDFEGNSQRGMR
jgi:DNA replication protein DnaC